MAIRVKDLFKVEAVNSGTSALEFIAHSRKKIWPPFYPSTTKPKETDICGGVFPVGSKRFEVLQQPRTSALHTLSTVMVWFV